MNKKLIRIILLTAAITANAATMKELESSGINDKMKDDLMASIEMKQASEAALVKSAGSFVTVGSQNSCDYFNGSTLIQDAIDDGNAEIRITGDANTSYTENLLIDDVSVTLKGGYADCDAANNDTQSGQTEIGGAGGADLPVIRIQGSSERHTIILDSLYLRLGSGSGLFPGGAISSSTANAQITLTNSLLANNTSASGGGISINGGDTDYLIEDTLITNNTAGFAGGVLCKGSEASITMLGDSGVSLNTADGNSGDVESTGKGGGLYISNGCLFTSYAGTVGADDSDLRGISGNTATDQGGGVFASDGGTVNLWGFKFCSDSCLGDNTTPSNLNGNRAESDGLPSNTALKAGSGAFITGTDTNMTIFSGRVEFNDVGNTGADGGGIYADAGSTFTTGRITNSCWDRGRCNYYGNNASGSNDGDGGAFFNRESTMVITNTVIANNRSDDATVLSTTGANANTTIRGSLIHSNADKFSNGLSDSYVFNVTFFAELDIERSTIADNNARFAVFRIFNAETSLNIQSSIVSDASSGNVLMPNPGAVSNSCTIFHESVSIPNLAGSSVVDDPEFVDRNNYNFHLNPSTSPAIDYCNASPGPTPLEYRDMDYEAYGFDDPTVANNLGPYDIGADETYANGDLIFENGFEEWLIRKDVL